MAKVRRHVVRMAEYRETDILKPIDTIIKRMITSCQAATKVNVEVAPKVIALKVEPATGG
jgi:hypothetical protein